MNHIQLFENFNQGGRKEFTDAEIQYYQKLWDWLHEKYRYNKFFSNLWDKVKTKKSLTNKQWIELEFLLKNGKSRYEAGILPNNY
jgi:hypothetical protein